jgi:DtxR family Mn-dependent transcriptional regulator
MTQPALALLVFVLLTLGGALAFWPGRGIVSRVVRLRESTEKVRLEDALKHLYKYEYAGWRPSVESVAGSVGVNRARAVQILTRLEEMELARAKGNGFVLTEEGRDYALHVVRTHRLLERYLADRTGLEPRDWHPEAEREEHRLSPADADTLSARLGHPLYDPHGDPIPTAGGDLPRYRGVPLPSLDAGTLASITHLEDEPEDVYEALTRRGLAPGMSLFLLESSPGEIRFEAGGRKHSLRPVEAGNVTVVPLLDEEGSGGPGEPEETGRSLAELREGEEGRVLLVGSGLQGPQRRRLMDLGLVPGTVVRAELRSAGGDPTAYRIRGALIALRREQARWIRVEA